MWLTTDQKLLKSTKFPKVLQMHEDLAALLGSLLLAQTFDEKVDLEKVNFAVIEA